MPSSPIHAAAARLDLRDSVGAALVHGADAEAYLQRQISGDLRKATPDRGILSTLMTRKGKLVAAFELYRVPDGAGFVVVCERTGLAPLLEGLERLVILEDVQFVAECAEVWSVQGPTATAVLNSAAGAALPDDAEERAVSSLSIGGAELRAVRRARCAAGGWDLLVPADASDAVVAALETAGAEAVDAMEAETARIVAGIPRFGVDADDSNLPPESGYAGAISYDKGCYVGQEIVARIRTYGHVNKELRRIDVSGGVPEVGAEVRHDDAAVGTVTSVAPAEGGAVAIAYLKRAYLEPETTVEVVVGESTCSATVGALHAAYA